MERFYALCFLGDANDTGLMLDISAALISHLSSHLLQNQSLRLHHDNVNVVLIYWPYHTIIVSQYIIDDGKQIIVCQHVGFVWTLTTSVYRDLPLKTEKNR